MTTYTTRFEKVERRTIRSGRCPVCQKRVTRSTTFMQTINPFNKNPDGSLKTREQIRAELEQEAAAWVPDFTHAGCES